MLPHNPTLDSTLTRRFVLLQRVWTTLAHTVPFTRTLHPGPTWPLVVQLIDPAFPDRHVTLEVRLNPASVQQIAQECLFLPATERLLIDTFAATPSLRPPHLILNLAEVYERSRQQKYAS